MAAKSKKEDDSRKEGGDARTQEIIENLKTAYNMEIETVINYLANSVWLDGIRAKHIKDSLQAEVQDELTHAQTLADRIKTLDGKPPGSLDLKWTQSFLQPPENSVDVKAVIRGVIEAEEGAIAQYHKLIEMCDGVDYVTQDLCIGLKSDEEQHRRLFKGYLLEVDHL